MIDQLYLSLYRCLTLLYFPFSKLVIKWRIKRGKEHSTRWKEKLGEPSVESSTSGRTTSVTNLANQQIGSGTNIGTGRR